MAQPIKLLNLENQKLKLPYEMLCSIRENTVDANQAIEDLNLYQDHAHPDYEPYYLFFLANITTHVTGNKDELNKTWVANSLEKATRMFRRLGEGETWNEAIVHWQYGLYYLTEGKKALADRELHDAKKLLTGIGAMSEWRGDYDRRDACAILIQKIEHELFSFTAVKTAEPVIPATHPFVLPIEKLEKLALPVYFVNAHPDGTFSFDNEEDETTFDGSFINNIEHRLYNIRSRNTSDPIDITMGEYAWYRVRGNSMNAATPIPIDNGDYVLVLINTDFQKAKFNDIVVAAVSDPTSIADREGVVKRYAAHGFVSESTDDYKEISFSNAIVQGVVIAIAKPIENAPMPDETDKTQDIYATSTIKGNLDNKMSLFRTYQIEAGILHETITKQQNKYLIPFELLIYADGMEIAPNWHHPLSLDLASSSSFVEFSVTPTEIGTKDILIEYFYKRHWLGRIKHTVEVVERR